MANVTCLAHVSLAEQLSLLGCGVLELLILPQGFTHTLTYEHPLTCFDATPVIPVPAKNATGFEDLAFFSCAVFLVSLAYDRLVCFVALRLLVSNGIMFSSVAYLHREHLRCASVTREPLKCWQTTSMTGVAIDFHSSRKAV